MHTAPPATLRMQPRARYLALLLTAAQQGVAYRGRTLLSLIGNGLWIVVVYYLWYAVFGNNTQIAGFDWASMRTYLVLSYAINALLAFSSTARLFGLVRTGDIASELLRPVDYLAAQLALATGAALVEGALSAVLAIAIGIFVVGVQPPASLGAAVLFVPSIMLGFLIKFLFTFLVSLLCFWTINSIGLIWAQTALVNLLSGALLPLAFFPDWLQPVVRWAPFSGIVATPLAIYQGQTGGAALGLQVGWVIVLWAMARAVWGPATRALDIQGG